MRIAISTDHGGFELKKALVDYIRSLGYDLVDYGTDSEASVDYPDFVLKVGKAIQDQEAEKGIVICGSGVGVCIASNKMKGVYAAICHDIYSAAQGVEHDNMNVLCLGGRVIGVELGKALVKAFLEARFVGHDAGNERHLRRTNKVRNIEEEEMN
ncbi:MAG: ribose 5-phosphate isomerase B [Chloroflexota bacterium]|nr:MAG: ribose 5-phosphate isomerase B [Chloroflexota bacterium]HDD60932.1 ribose 5-phosphate isomerase B [Chloroflexota bacterium]